MTLISVALCTHNGERYIEQQLRSIAAQSMQPAELVISDDASTDATLEIVARVTAEFDFSVTVLENSSALGVTANFAQAIGACSGELIALSDQDDVWHAHKLKTMAHKFDQDPQLLLVSANARLVDGSGHPLDHSLFDALELTTTELDALSSGTAFDSLLRRNLITGATVMIRRELNDLAVPYPQGWVHDEWLAIMAAVSDGIGMLPESLTDYRQHGANEIGATRLGFGAKLRRLTEPRGSRYKDLLSRAEALLDRLDTMGVSQDRLEKAAQKVEHHRIRASLPAPRVLRLVGVIREARTGRYSLYSRGWLDVARDLLQPTR